MAGYQLTLDGMEKNPAHFVVADADGPEASILALSSGGTITVSATNVDDI